ELASIFGPIDAGRLEADSLEAGLVQLGAVLAFLQGARYAPDPELHALANRRRNLTADHDVRDREPPAGAKDPEGPGEHPVLVGGKVDHTIGDDDIHGIVRKGNGLDLPFEELGVGDTGPPLVPARQRQHLIRHVEPVDLAAWP